MGPRIDSLTLIVGRVGAYYAVSSRSVSPSATSMQWQTIPPHSGHGAKGSGASTSSTPQYARTSRVGSNIVGIPSTEGRPGANPSLPDDGSACGGDLRAEGGDPLPILSPRGVINRA